MARKLTFEEMRAFTPPIEAPEGFVSEAESISQILMEKRDKALELSPESNQWFGDHVPGAFGFHW